MRTLRALIFSLIDGLLPNKDRYHKARGKFARILLGIPGAENLTLGKNVELGRGFGDMAIGRNCYIFANCSFRVWNTIITIGDNCMIQDGCIFFSGWDAPITIGENVQVGTESILWNGSHEVGDEFKRAGAGTARPIEIGLGSWLGIRTTIHANIGTGCIVDSGAVVFKTVPPNSHVGGNPARVIRTIPPKEETPETP